LEHYGIKGKILEWMMAWFTQRQQCVVVEGETSGKAPNAWLYLQSLLLIEIHVIFFA
jgi:hypothetical protein